MIDPRRTRLRKIWRFLPTFHKSSGYPKQVELPRTYYHHGTLYLYYVIGNRVILIVREPIATVDITRRFIKDRVIKQFSESVSIEEILEVESVSKLEKEFQEVLSVSDSYNYDIASRIKKWIWEYLSVNDLVSYITANLSVRNFLDTIYSNDSISYSIYDRLIRQFTENLRIYELIPVIKRVDRDFWFFRERIIVTDGIYGGYPSREYPSKMQYFRLITEKVFPETYKVVVESSLREEEGYSESISVNEIIDIKLVNVLTKELVEIISILDLINIAQIIRKTEQYQEHIDINDTVSTITGVLVPQSLTKAMAEVFLEHEQVIDYVTQSLSKDIAIIELNSS